MEGRVQGASPEAPNGKGCNRTCSNSDSITRRRYLVVGVALAVVAGCVGDEDSQADAVDSTSDDAATLTDDDEVTEDADDPVDDPSDDSDEEPEEALDVREDFESYILEMEITHEGPDGEWTQRVYRETDIANELIYQQFDMMGDGGEPGAFEHYIVDGEAYQILPDGTCTPSDEAAIRIHTENPGGFERPHPDEIDADAENITYGDTTTVAWVDEPVHVWEFDLESAFEAIDGVMQMYVGAESGYFVGYEGWYTTGAHDDPAEITIEYHRHSFNQDFEIEVPDECIDE